MHSITSCVVVLVGSPVHRIETEGGVCFYIPELTVCEAHVLMRKENSGELKVKLSNFFLPHSPAINHTRLLQFYGLLYLLNTVCCVCNHRLLKHF